MLNEIADYFDGILRTDEWKGIDSSSNGIQVENSGEVEKVAFAVDAAAQTIYEAGKRDADMLVVHHGIIWGGLERVTGQEYRRIRRLMKNDIALYVSHLPLDAHEEVGNNACLLRSLNATPTDTFGEVGGKEIGYVGRLPQPVDFDSFVYRVEDLLDFKSDVLGFGAEEVQEIAVLTGAGGDMVGEVQETGADVYISGEPKHRAYHDAQELGMNVVFAGHYQTETFGVKALQESVEREFDVETVFIDVPTSV
ncbi:MAG: Nif3-like dinuclear metal center hexameric protein [Halobacteria archaeon]|nr:Nif3-like dinuclear metal center hexameric protein [Halobacteria archaeon]